MSAKFRIFVDSTTDLPAELAEQFDVQVLPYIFTLDGKEHMNHLDWREISAKDFYDTLRAGKSATTTQITQTRYLDAWEPVLAAGCDVLYMCLSGALSKSYEQSVIAAQQAAEKYPDRRVITIDSRSASMGQGLLAHIAARGRDAGMPIEKVEELINNIIPRLHHWVMADDLHHLRRGGRVSGIKAVMGTMLNLKPILTILEDGRLVSFHKTRGRTKAIEYFLTCMDKYGVDTDYPIYLAHSDVAEFARQFEDAAGAKYPGHEITTSYIGPVIGAHTGPGTLAVIFVSKNPRARIE